MRWKTFKINSKFEIRKFGYRGKDGVAFGDQDRLRLLVRPESLDEAMDLSIEKWWHVFVWKIPHHGGVWSCGLCRWGKEAQKRDVCDDMCELCPVSLNGHDVCEGTPYKNYIDSGKRRDAWRMYKFLRNIKRKMK